MNKKITKIFCSILFVLVMLQGSCITVFAADDTTSTTEQPASKQLGTESAEICTSPQLGLRFISFIDQSYLNELKTKGNNVEYGTVAIAATVIENANEDETTILQIGKSCQYNKKTYKVTQVKATTNWAIKDGKVYFTGVLTGISGAGFNTRYAARAYVKVGGNVYYGDILKESGYTAAQKMVASSNVNTAQKESVIKNVMDACDAKKSNAVSEVVTISEIGEINADELPRNYNKVIVSSNTPDNAVVTLKDIRIKELEIQNGTHCTIRAEGNTIISSIETTSSKIATVALKSAKSVNNLNLLFGGESWVDKLIASESMCISTDGACCLCIPTLEVASQVNLDLNIPVNHIIVDKSAQGSTLTLDAKVENVSLSAGVTITGEADLQSVEINEKVDNLFINNDLDELTITEAASGSEINIEGTVTKAVIQGEDSTITGNGLIKEAEGNANNNIEVKCPNPDCIVSAKALDANHVEVTMENADTKLCIDNISLKKDNVNVEIATVKTEDNCVYIIETVKKLENNSKYTVCVSICTQKDEKEFECSYAVPEILSVEPIYVSGNYIKALKVSFKDVKEEYLNVPANVEIYNASNQLKSRGQSVNANGDGTYTINLSNQLSAGTYTFVLKMDSNKIEKEFVFTVPISISSVTTISKNSIDVTLNKATSEKLEVSAFTVRSKSGDTLGVTDAVSTDKKTYTLTLDGALTDGTVYTVSVTLPGEGRVITGDMTCSIPVTIESVEVQDAKTVVITMSKETSFISVGILKSGNTLQSTYTKNGNQIIVTLTNSLEAGANYTVSVLVSYSSILTKDFVYEIKEPENSIESVKIISVTWESKFEVTLKNATTRKLTKEDMAILCGGGRQMTILKAESDDNKIYEVTTGVFFPSDNNNEYTFSIITEEGKDPIQKTFVYDIDVPHDSQVEVLRTANDTAELSMSIDSECNLYWYIPNYTKVSNIARTKSIAFMTISGYDFDYLKANGEQEDAHLGLNRFVIQGLKEGQTYTLYYALENTEQTRHTEVRSITVGSNVVVDSHKSSEYTIQSVVESPRNVITIILNKEYPEYEHMTLGNFSFICPAGSPLTTKGGSLQKLDNGKKFIVTLPMNHYHKDNTYTAKVTLADGTYVEGTFRPDFNPPQITNATIKRTGPEELTVTFTSNEAGTVYMGTFNYDPNDNPTPMAKDVIGNAEVYHQAMSKGINSVTFEYNGTDKNVFAVYVDVNGNYNERADKLTQSIPEYVAPDPVDPNAPKIVSVTQEYDEYYDGYYGGSGQVLRVKFDKSLGHYYPDEMTLTSSSGNPVPNNNQYNWDWEYNWDLDDYDYDNNYFVIINFELGFERLEPGNYKIQMKLTDEEDTTKSITVSYDFTIQ